MPKRLQKRFTLGSLTPAFLAKLAILEPIAASGSARIALATFFSDLLSVSKVTLIELSKFW